MGVEILVFMMKGKRIKFAPLDRKHIDYFLKWFNDPEITQYLMMYKPLTRDWEEDWFDALKNRENDIFFQFSYWIRIIQEKSLEIVRFIA